MKVVVDVNVILSSLVKKGDSFEVFALNSLFNRFDFVAPEFLLVELEKHKERIFTVSDLSREIFETTLKMVIEQITLVSESEFSRYIPESKKLVSEHLKDIQYVALALKLNCPIFSGDKTLKNLIPDKVLNPKEMLSKIYSTE